MLRRSLLQVNWRILLHTSGVKLFWTFWKVLQELKGVQDCPRGHLLSVWKRKKTFGNQMEWKLYISLISYIVLCLPPQQGARYHCRIYECRITICIVILTVFLCWKSLLSELYNYTPGCTPLPSSHIPGRGVGKVISGSGDVGGVWGSDPRQHT